MRFRLCVPPQPKLVQPPDPRLDTRSPAVVGLVRRGQRVRAFLANPIAEVRRRQSPTTRQRSYFSIWSRFLVGQVGQLDRRSKIRDLLHPTSKSEVGQVDKFNHALICNARTRDTYVTCPVTRSHGKNHLPPCHPPPGASGIARWSCTFVKVLPLATY